MYTTATQVLQAVANKQLTETQAEVAYLIATENWTEKEVIETAQYFDDLRNKRYVLRGNVDGEGAATYVQYTLQETNEETLVRSVNTAIELLHKHNCFE